MDGREARGRVLAQAQGDRIRQIEADLWFCPSSEGGGGYVVSVGAVGASGRRCGCPDENPRCKHIVAVEIIRAERAKADSTPVETAPASPVAIVPAAPPVPVKAARTPPPKGDFTADEQAAIRRALRHLGTKLGWPAVARGVRFQAKTVRKIAYGNKVCASIAVRLARFAGTSIDAIVTGQYPPKCPTCGQIMPPSPEPTP